MSQQRITLFFPVESRRKKTPSRRSQFLALPPSIRRQIYHSAGLATGMTFHINRWATRKKSFPSRHVPFNHGSHAELPPLPTDLFPVCRLVNQEITQAFYSENYFAITRQCPRGLRALERFRDSTLRQIRFLAIRVNVDSCIETCCGHRLRRCGNGNRYLRNFHTHDAPLDAGITSHHNTILQWQQICARLSNAEPGRLTLFIICDCADRYTADMVVTLLSTFPILKDCALRIARDHNDEMQRLAEDTVYRLTGRSPPPRIPPFQFLRLPKEIQLNILNYTKLVNGHHITCDESWMNYGDSCSVGGAPAPVPYEGSGLLACFCSKSHSAFNFRCQNCKSLGFPLALFLVSRGFRDLATKVFYGKNVFAVSIVDDTSPYYCPSAMINRPMSIVPNLTRFPNGAIQFLTSLIFSFEVCALHHLRSNRLDWKHWVDTIELLSKEANLAVLRLQVQLKESWYCTASDLQIVFEASWWERMSETYHRLVQPMACLKGLQDFFVHIKRRSGFLVPDESATNWPRELEYRLERIVMGQKYDAWKRGKTVYKEL